VFKLDNAKVPDGTVLLMGAQYENQTTDKVWTYALLKAGGLWYVTGTGGAPQAAGWGAINRWIERAGLTVLWVKGATGWAELYPSPE
jgi:hypothetical protein